MKTKSVKISIRIEDDALQGVLHIIDLVSAGEEAEFDITVDDFEKNKLEAYYEYDGSEINGTFIDRQVCEDYFTVQSAAIESDKLYQCKGSIVNVTLSDNKERVLFDVEVPLFACEEEEEQQTISAPLSEAQVIPFIAGTPELQKYEIRIVGIRHHASEETYACLKELSRKRGEVMIRHEPDNKTDPSAVGVFLSSGEKIGYVASQYLPVVFPAVRDCSDCTAIITYMENEGASATALMKFESGVSAMSVQLFSQYTPAEVYKAYYLYRQWGGILEKEEKDLFATDEHRIDFDSFFAMDITDQNRIASLWEERLRKATVENPTNPGRRMNVPLDLSWYGTSWKDFDIANTKLIQTIEQDNKVMAIYFRYRRTEPGGLMVSPREFVDEVVKVDASEELINRLEEVFEKKMC